VRLMTFADSYEDIERSYTYISKIWTPLQ
jgi:hypothetical protein